MSNVFVSLSFVSLSNTLSFRNYRPTSQSIEKLFKYLNILILVTPKMVKVSFDLEEGLHKEIRKSAIDKGITMKAYIVELIEKGKRLEETEDIE